MPWGSHWALRKGQAAQWDWSPHFVINWADQGMTGLGNGIWLKWDAAVAFIGIRAITGSRGLGSMVRRSNSGVPDSQMPDLFHGFQGATSLTSQLT